MEEIDDAEEREVFILGVFHKRERDILKNED